MLYDIITYLPMFVTAFWSINLLITKGKQGKAKIMFGLFLAVACLLYTSHAIYFQGTKIAYLFIDPIYTFATLAVYPLYFWYIKQLTTDKEYNLKNLRLLLPAFILSITTALLYTIMDHDERALYIQNFLFGNSPIEAPTPIIKAQIFTYFTARISFIVTIIYVFVKGRPTVINHNKELANFFSDINQKDIKWVNQMLIAFIFTSVISIFLNIVGRSRFLDSDWIAIPSLTFSVLLFILGHLAYHQKFDISNLNMTKQLPLKLEPANKKDLLLSLNVEFSKNKIYRQQELKITDLASILNTNRTYISKLINQEFGCSFNEFVNRFRIEEAKSLIKEECNEPLEQIAIKVGYGSLSTFFRSFKLQEGVTPNHYRKLVNKSDE